MVKSEEAYSPQNYIEAVTGRCYLFHSDSIVGTIAEIHSYLKGNGYDLWDYPLSEIDEIVSNEINVVLVELTGEDDDGEWKTVYRWFKVPVDFHTR